MADITPANQDWHRTQIRSERMLDRWRYMTREQNPSNTMRHRREASASVQQVRPFEGPTLDGPVWDYRGDAYDRRTLMGSEGVSMQSTHLNALQFYKRSLAFFGPDHATTKLWKARLDAWQKQPVRISEVN